MALHFRVGWWALLVFIVLGLFLESLHGFKIGYYLDVANEARRTAWRLAHVHGALISVLNLVFAASIRAVPHWTGATRTLASRCYLGALVLMPLGFFLGGLFIYAGDPGLGILLVPPGGLLLIVAVASTARGFTRSIQEGGSA